MIKKLGNILTYYDSEPTEVLQGLIWMIFAPMVLMVAYPDLWYVSVLSILVGFYSLYSVCYLDLKYRKISAISYSIISLFFAILFLKDNGLSSDPMNWGWVVICISAIGNIRRVNQKIVSSKNDKKTKDISKMYREDLEKKIEDQQKELFDLRMENIKLHNKIEDHD